MAMLEVRVRYFAQDVWVLPELLGRVVHLTRDGTNVRVELPLRPDDFQPSADAKEVPPTPACFMARTFTDPTGPDTAIAIRLFSVSVSYEADVPNAQPPSPPDGFFDDVQEKAQRGLDIANDVAHDFLRWLRVSCLQEWLGLSEDPPAQYGRAGVLNADTGNALMGLGPVVTVTFRSTKLAISDKQWSTISRSLIDHADPLVTDALLADVRHMLKGTDAPDAQRAVLVAAMACEIKAKQTVRVLGGDEQRALLDMVLKRVSNAPELLGGPLEALGRPPLKVSDPELNTALKALNNLRDRVVHAGVTVTPSEAESHLLTADRLFTWLDGLDSSRSHDHPGGGSPPAGETSSPVKR